MIPDIKFNYEGLDHLSKHRRMTEFGLVNRVAQGLKLVDAYCIIHDIHPEAHCFEGDKAKLRAKEEQRIDGALDVLAEAGLNLFVNRFPGAVVRQEDYSVALSGFYELLDIAQTRGFSIEHENRLLELRRAVDRLPRATKEGV